MLLMLHPVAGAVLLQALFPLMILLVVGVALLQTPFRLTILLEVGAPLGKGLHQVDVVRVVR